MACPLSLKNRKTFFYAVCLPFRLCIAIIAAATESTCDYTCRVIGAMVCLFVFFSFTKNFFVHKPGFFGAQRHDETLWWHHVRPLHAVLYLVAAILLWSDVKKWWWVLVVDVLVAIVTYKKRAHCMAHQYINIAPDSSDAAALHVT